MARGALGGNVSEVCAPLDGIRSVGGNSHSEWADDEEVLDVVLDVKVEGELAAAGGTGLVGGDAGGNIVLGGSRAGGGVLRAVGSPPKRGRRGAGRGGVPPGPLGYPPPPP